MIYDIRYKYDIHINIQYMNFLNLHYSVLYIQFVKNIIGLQYKFCIHFFELHIL